MTEPTTTDGDRMPLCPNGCYKRKPLQWVGDQWYCPKCGDEWGSEVEQSSHGGDQP